MVKRKRAGRFPHSGCYSSSIPNQPQHSNLTTFDLSTELLKEVISIVYFTEKVLANMANYLHQLRRGYY